MPNATELWYCDNIVSGPWPFLLLGLPLVGAYYYGRGKTKLAWILIGVWIPIQIALSFTNNIVVACPSDDLPMLEQAPPPQAPQ